MAGVAFKQGQELFLCSSESQWLWVLHGWQGLYHQWWNG